MTTTARPGSPPSFDPDPSVRRSGVVVVGAGLAGLLAARLLGAADVPTTVLDANHTGGRAVTDRCAGFLLNRGPHALYLGGPAERTLARLGVPLSGRPPAAASGLLGDLVAPLPTGVRTLLSTPLLGGRGRLAAARLLARIPRCRPEDVAASTAEDWLADQHLPADAELLVRMLARVSTYTDLLSEVSADLVVQQLQRTLAHGVRYLDGGWQQLVDHLEKGVQIERASVLRVERDGRHVVVHTSAGGTIVARAAILAAGGPAVAAAVLDRPAFDVGPPAEVACLDLGTTRPADPPVLFGLDQPLYLSDHGVAARLTDGRGSVVHVARYLGRHDVRAPAEGRAELERHAARAGLGPETVVTGRYLHRMVACTALPTASLGGLRGRPPVTATGVAGVFLAGDWVGPTGHLLDAVAGSASVAAEHAARAATLAAG